MVLDAAAKSRRTSSAIVLPRVVFGSGWICVVGWLLLSIWSCTCSFVYLAVPLFVHICLDQCCCALIVFVNVFSHPGQIGVVTCARSGFLVLCALALWTDRPCFVLNVFSHC